MHKATSRFWKCYQQLPLIIKRHADDNFALLKENPRHPSLHFKKAGKVWSVRIGLEYRAIAIENDSDFIWVWIGSHDEYERMIIGIG
jgi:hypothetical protein